MLVKDIMQTPQRRLAPKDIGLEIEVEGRNLPRLERFWRTDKDGSLRGEESAEYVLARPMALNEVQDALNYLDKAYIQYNSRVDESVRAGVHVHINCQQLTPVQLYNFFTLYLVLENILIKYCGEWRDGNLFCLKCKDAEALLYNLIDAAKDKQFLLRFQNDDFRYASMNVKALGDYGSLEFRSMRSTRDLDKIMDWVKILYGLREQAVKFDNPIQIIQQVSMAGTFKFLEECLGDYAELFYKTDQLDSLLWDGIELAQCLAYCVDWNKWCKPILIGGIEFPDDGNFYDEPMGDV